jgi:hypothetical protein
LKKNIAESYIYNRNYGCRIKEIIERGYRFIILENEKIRIAINIDKGAEISEFLYKPYDTDFMWKSPSVVYSNRKNLLTKNSTSGNFLDLYEGGWQDLLPNIGIPTNYLGADFGAHGEIYTVSWSYIVEINTPIEIKVILEARLNRAPLFVTKKFLLKSECAFVEVEEIIRNEAEIEYQIMWGQHPCFGKPFLNEDCVISVPDHKRAVTYKAEISDNNKIIPLNKEFTWPHIEGNDGVKLNLSKVLSEGSKTAFMFRLEDLKNGWFGLTNIKKGLGFGMVWDKKVFKNLWFWAVYRGCSYYPWYGRTYNLAIEPWSSKTDDFNESLKNDECLKLRPGKELKTKFTAIVFKSQKLINGFDENYDIL